MTIEIQKAMSAAWEQDRATAVYRGRVDDAYELGFIAAWRARSKQMPDIVTLKNLFRAYAADVEKVANEMVQPHASGQISVPPEIIDYWLEHLETIVTVDAKSLLKGGTRNLTAHQKAVEEAAGMPLDWNMAAAFEVGKK